MGVVFACVHTLHLCRTCTCVMASSMCGQASHGLCPRAWVGLCLFFLSPVPFFVSFWVPPSLTSVTLSCGHTCALGCFFVCAVLPSAYHRRIVDCRRRVCVGSVRRHSPGHPVRSPAVVHGEGARREWGKGDAYARKGWPGVGLSAHTQSHTHRPLYLPVLCPVACTCVPGWLCALMGT